MVDEHPGVGMSSTGGGHRWAGVTAAIATKHGKERQFGPPLAAWTGMELIVADVDTDELGTFTGERPRPGSALEIGRRKALWAIEHSGTQLGLGNEGSFGPHPEAPMLASSLEVAVLVDPREDLEVVEQIIALETNYQHIEVEEAGATDGFLDAIGFPAHAVVVSSAGGTGPMFKGLQDAVSVERAVTACLHDSGRALIQTDMRAHLNPTRQRALTLLAEKLAHRLTVCCPACAAPGWGIVGVETGLTCELCRRPTPLVAADVDGCARRGCQERRIRPRTELAPAARCPRCNP